MSTDTLRSILKENIQKSVILKKENGYTLVGPGGGEMRWLFDFRSVLLDAVFLNAAAELFWEQYKDTYPFQVGGLESASIPLIAAIVLKGKERGTPINGFYIRKSRKTEGMQKIIEGKLTDEPAILVDDLINGGGTFLRQIETLKTEGRTVRDIFAIIRFRDLSHYKFAETHNLKISTIFSLVDFDMDLMSSPKLPNHDAFRVKWYKHYAKANYFHRIPKSAPVVDDENIYIGGDDGAMRAFRQDTGEEVWKFQMLGLGTSGKMIFSTAALYADFLYFGAYDGNFYALDKHTGQKRWMYVDADWIGSSPCVAPDLGLAYVGLEFGLWGKTGGIVALDTTTGKKRWEYTMPSLTHGSPAYSKKFNMVVVGSNNGVVYAFNAKTGALLWEFQTGAEVRASLTFDEKRGYLLFGSYDASIYIVNVKNGALVSNIQTGGALYCTPLILGDCAYFTSLDKRIYCIDLETISVAWKFAASSRIFASPIVADGMLYVGANDGRLYELNPQTGENTAFFQTTERITNKIAYNHKNKSFFVPTYANEVYCIEKK